MGHESRHNPTVLGWQAQQQAKQLREALAKASLSVADRFGRPLLEGATVVFAPALAPCWTVNRISPDLSQPPGMGKVVLRCELTIPVMLGRMIPEFMVVAYPQLIEEATEATALAEATPDPATPEDPAVVGAPSAPLVTEG